jgi:hypothetical protein
VQALSRKTHAGAAGTVVRAGPADPPSTPARLASKRVLDQKRHNPRLPGTRGGLASRRQRSSATSASGSDAVNATWSHPARLSDSPYDDERGLQVFGAATKRPTVAFVGRNVSETGAKSGKRGRRQPRQRLRNGLQICRIQTPEEHG